MRRTSFLVLLSALTPACSAITDFGFTFSDGGAIDATTTDGGHDAGPVDATVPDGALDEGVDGGEDGGMPCPVACDDGNPCNGVETCDTTMGACVTGTPVSCVAADPCHMDGTCDMASGGCIPGALITGDDGDPCNGVETCVVVGTMMTVSHSGPRCDDGVDCTRDTCDMATGGCTSMPTDASCAATEICRVTAPPSCTTTACTAASGCGTGQICFAGFCCAPAVGMCLHVMCMTNGDCSDTRACNGAEVCDLTTHSCQSGTPLTCDDGLACSVDACVDMAGGAHTCQHSPGDGDGDGYLDKTCIAGSGDDCNDSDPTIHPTATERCNGVDDNCDGAIDETFSGGASGLGHSCMAGVGACTASGAFVCAPSQLSTVCNAMPGAPGANELCGNGIDDNCNGATDEGYATGGTCTVGTGACTATGTLICSVDLLSTVCNTGPGSPGNELCGNSIDDNCNGMIDEGFGMRGTPCSVGIGACQRNGALNCSADLLSLVCTAMPGTPSPETCNMIDDNCDGVIDNGPSMVWYQDRDGDTYGDTGTASTFVGFCPPGGFNWVLTGGDCDDTNNRVHPGASEDCTDTLDNDCNGLVNDGCPPPNDVCGTALGLGPMSPGRSGTRTDRFDQAGVHDATDCAAPTSPGNDVWYAFMVPPGPGVVMYMDTFGSTYDTILAIHPDCAMPGTTVACNDDSCMGNASRVAAYLPGGTSWKVSVRAYFSSSPLTGMLTLTWQVLQPGSGARVALPPGAPTYTDSRALPTGPGLATGSCRDTSGFGENLYYFMKCPGGMPVVVHADTCMTTPIGPPVPLDTVVYMGDYAGASDLACDDDGCGGTTRMSTINGTVTAPGIYGIYVDQLYANTSPVTLSVTGLPP